MASSYEPIAQPRFAVEQTPDGDQIRIKASKQWFALLFLPIWLTLWMIGGFAAGAQLLTRFEPFLAVWMCAWLFGLVMVAGTLVWMLAGSETIRVVGSDLEVGRHALGWSRRWLYSGARINNLSAVSQPGGWYRFRFDSPFFRGMTGSVKFDYGPRTIYVAAGLTEAEARMVVGQLLTGLPAGRPRAS